MIEKMKFLSITGPKEDIDRVVDTYLSRYEIHLENALSELKTVKDLRPYIETNPYKDVLERASELLESYHDLITDQTDRKMKLEEAVEVINSLDTQLKELTERKNALVRQRDELKASRDRVVPFAGLNYNVKEILKFRFIKFRFGRISREYYEKFSSYVYETIDTVMFKCEEEGDYVWVVYFVPESLADKIDAIYASMHFERCFLPDEYEGTPVEAGHVLDDRIGSLQKEIDEADRKIVEAMSSRKDEFAAALRRIRTFSTNFDVRKMAAVTKHDTHNFYILCGWMTENDAKRFQKEIERDSDTFCIIEDDHNNIMSTPPTKMKNPGLFRPFEMYVEMYGLPSYHEMDPTIFVALTYMFIFGAMFGDAGQGACLVIGGFLLYKFKKMDLAAIIGTAGIFSTFFGLMFGSIFGFEDVIPALWLRPVEAMSNLPFLGTLNTVFVVAIAFGMFLILITMIFHIINAVRMKDVEGIWFDQNAVAGLVFYGSLVAVIFLFMTGHTLPAGAVLGVMFGIPLVIIMLKEPLARMVKKESPVIEGSKGMYFVQSFFELFEVMLSYLSNTLSFVRIGAFAVSHAAMMEVVLMLAGAESGNLNWIVVVLGNLFVCGMEGLIVGIQVLRLEYYEMFSRFYKGTGRKFEPFLKKSKNK